MFRIGEFSKLSLTTIKALRYYEKESLICPAYVDEITGYRFYETKQLEEVSRIKALRQIGFTIEEIKGIQRGDDFKAILKSKEEELNDLSKNLSYQLKTIKYLLEEKNMKYQIVLKELPECIVYYEERVLPSYEDFCNLVLESAQECERLNPGIECVKPDYCFAEYLDKEYRESNVLTRYSQAVTKMGVENERIHFKKIDKVNAICIYHKGSYSKLGDAYSFIVNYARENGYEMNGVIREVYIDGVWNKDNEDDYLTEIQMPIKK